MNRARGVGNDVLNDLLLFTRAGQAPFWLRAELAPQTRLVGQFTPGPAHPGRSTQAYWLKGKIGYI